MLLKEESSDSFVEEFKIINLNEDPKFLDLLFFNKYFK